MLYREMRFLFLLSILTSFQTFGVVEESNGIERSQLRFVVGPSTIDLIGYAQRLATAEKPLTEHIATCRPGGTAMTNICLASFVMVYGSDLYEVPLLDYETDDQIVFESSAGSCFLSSSKKNLQDKRVKFPSLSGTANPFERFSFGKYSHDGLKDRYDKTQLSKLKQEGDIKKCEKEIDATIDEIISHFSRFWQDPHTKNWDPVFLQLINELEEKKKEIVRITDDETEDGAISVTGGDIYSLIEQLKTMGESTWTPYAVLPSIRLYIERITKKSDDLADKMMGIAASLWCSEQKLMKYLYTEDEWLSSLIEYDSTLKYVGNLDSLFLMIHSYQFPCYKCRLTFNKYLEELRSCISSRFKREIIFHVIITYREEYKDGGYPVTHAPDDEIPEISSIKDSVSIYKTAV
jgi:hypothetical protein